MLASYKWLQSYFDESLPAPEKVAELLTFHSWEIEGQEKKSDDTIFDVKVLPDKACYGLSHWGIAYELAAILGKKIKPTSKPSIAVSPQKTKDVSVEIKDSELGYRYIGRLIENISIKNSTKNIAEKLEVLGQRSINNIVDLTNFVMLDIGQPMHAFDADIVKGGITVRRAKAGEKMTTLDGKDVELKETMLVIADDAGILAIAGVKGGNRAGITQSTKNIILEAASFNAESVRRTSTVLNLKTDSSKRFENRISQHMAEQAMNYITSLIAEINPDAKIGEIVDVYPTQQKPVSIPVTTEYISTTLGIEISESEILSILEKLHVKVTKQKELLILDIPFFRLDLTIPEDIVEEVGRMYGLEKIKPVALPKRESEPEILKNFYYAQKVRNILIGEGASEVYTQSLTDGGEVEIQNPLASDKRAMRTDLAQGITKALELNARNAPLLGLAEVKIFEIGKVFTKKHGEYISLALGVKAKKEAVVLEEILKKLSESLGVDIKKYGKINKNIFEANFEALVKDLKGPTAHELQQPSKPVKYQKISPYPFILRDIAVFVPEGVDESVVRDVITPKAGNLLVRLDLFDVFKKDSKTSYAFHLVFQSTEKTLTDDEINKIMDAITGEMSGKGWQVR